jgi:transposase
MRGETPKDSKLFSYVSLEQRVPSDHPLREMRRMTDEVLSQLSGRFDEIYSRVGRPSIPPEHLLRAILLQLLYSVRSERQLMEQLDYNLLFRWFVGLDMDAQVWNPTTFTKNRDRMLEGDIAREFFSAVVEMARQKGMLSAEHFTVDGTMIEAWASHKSFRRKDGGGGPGPGTGRYFEGERRSNETHESTTDPEARLYRKTNHGEAKLAYLGHVVIENRNGLAVAGCVTVADGFAERAAALEMISAIPGHGQITLGADKAYDVRSFVDELRRQGVTPHVAQNTTNRASAIDARTTRHPGYAQSQSCRPKVERVPAYIKNIANLRKVKLRGRSAVDWLFVMGLAVFNLVRIRNLVVAT